MGRPRCMLDKVGVALCMANIETGEKMEISMNIMFPRVPCELITLDIMDVSGELQMGVNHGVNKVRLSPENEGSHAIEINALDL